MDKAMIVVEHVGLTDMEKQRLLLFIRELKRERKQREEPPLAYIWSGDGGGIAPVIAEKLGNAEGLARRAEDMERMAT